MFKHFHSLPSKCINDLYSLLYAQHTYKTIISLFSFLYICNIVKISKVFSISFTYFNIKIRFICIFYLKCSPFLRLGLSFSASKFHCVLVYSCFKYVSLPFLLQSPSKFFQRLIASVSFKSLLNTFVMRTDWLLFIIM